MGAPWAPPSRICCSSRRFSPLSSAHSVCRSAICARSLSTVCRCLVSFARWSSCARASFSRKSSISVRSFLVGSAERTRLESRSSLCLSRLSLSASALISSRSDAMDAVASLRCFSHVCRSRAAARFSWANADFSRSSLSRSRFTLALASSAAALTSAADAAAACALAIAASELAFCVEEPELGSRLAPASGSYPALTTRLPTLLPFRPSFPL